MSPYRFKRLQQKITKQKLVRAVKRLVIAATISFLLFVLLNFLFPLNDDIEYSTIVTDSQGQMVNAYLTKDDKWRLRTGLEEISPLLRKTIIAKEDRYFYSHPGVNLLAVCRAAVMNVLHFKRTSGASTITMQVARALEPRKRNLLSKFIEVFRAFQLEWKYSKDEILQLYFNLVPYGGNIEGVKSASLLYLQKNPDHLSLAEITALSIIPNRPSSLVIGKNNDLIIKERNRWLEKFRDDEVFTGKEIEDAIREPFVCVRTTLPHQIPHLSYFLKSRLKQQEVNTNIITNTQLKLEKLTEDYVRSLRLKNIRNAAVMVIDNRSHKVVAYLGSSGFTDRTDGGQVNGVAAIRQPGSTLKPLLYGLCFDQGLLTPQTIVNDVPINYNGYAPENYDQNFNGYVTVEHALEHSLNIPAVKSLQLLGKDRMIQSLASVDFRQIKADQNKLGLSLILGGCGATLEQLTGLFSAFANGGIYIKPSLLKEDVPGSGKRILSQSASFMITDILCKVNRPDFPVNWMATEHMPKIAWKTGTSYGRKDAWSVGYNKNYTVGVWVGNFSGLGVPDLSGANTATPLLFKIFNTIDYDSNSDWYAPPSGCELRTVCSETGLPPGPLCTNLISDYFIPLVSSTVPCQHLQEIKISADESMSYCNSCAPQNGYKKKLFKIIVPEMQEYFFANKKAFDIIPLHNPDCERIFGGNSPSITSPVNGNEYFISSLNPEPLQLSANAGADASKLFWYINDEFFKSCKPTEKIFFTPTAGPQKISCTDDKGRNRNVKIVVKYVKM